MIAHHGSSSWKLKCIVAEVDCLGHIPPSFRKALQLIGFTSKELETLVVEYSLVLYYTVLYYTIPYYTIL